MLPRTKTGRRVTGVKLTRQYRARDSRPLLANADLRDTGEISAISAESIQNAQIASAREKIQELTHKLTTAEDKNIFLEAVNNTLKDKIATADNSNQALRSMMHELNNIMLVVQCDTSSVLEQIKYINPETSEIISELLLYSKRMSELVGAIMNFSKEKQPDLKQVNLKNLIKDLVKNLQRKFIDHQILFTEDQMSDNKFETHADKHLLIEAILNLIKNAAEATPKTGKITISLNIAGRNFICISVRDTGCGIPQENLEKVFEPNFSTKRTGHGIGLSNVKKTIESHKGFIKVISRINEGTEFFVFIPATI